MSQLLDRLRANRTGMYARDAATDLVADHGWWLQRADFVAACVDGGDVAPFVDWGAVPVFLASAPCSPSEAQVLQLAAELAGVDSGVPLCDLLSGLDHVNQDLVVAAVSYAMGRHER